MKRKVRFLCVLSVVVSLFEKNEKKNEKKRIHRPNGVLLEREVSKRDPPFKMNSQKSPTQKSNTKGKKFPALIFLFSSMKDTAVFVRGRKNSSSPFFFIVDSFSS